MSPDATSPAAGGRVVLAGALDTKGPEHAFVRDLLAASGLRPLLVDVGIRGEPSVRPDVTRAEVARAGGRELREIAALPARGEALAAMADGVLALMESLRDAGGVDAAFGMGGSGALAVLAPGFRALPLGVPKMIVTTMASSDTRPHVGASDLLLVPSIVDIAGLNTLSRFVLERSVAMLAAQLRHPVPAGPGGGRGEGPPMVAASMFGVTTAGVSRACRVLESRGLDVLVFHANGLGGRTLESLAGAGWLAGVLDLTTTELADDLAGGVASAGPDRLTAAGRRGVPQVVAPGALDIVNFGAPASVPEPYRERRLYAHNATATLMRTDPGEAAVLGARLGAKLSAARGPVTVLLPTGGLSALSEPGGAFHWPEADEALERALLAAVGPEVVVERSPAAVNAPAFGERAAELLLHHLSEHLTHTQAIRSPNDG
ncbi:Tm-1-like ATP-binding domain-containing protein [Actinomadura viridis]|uniref:Tm-1-like ATP-binding domain-containing protein n=1 Tax=Actinomadura viridis TaxID=58110 RepID=UPI0036BA4B17